MPLTVATIGRELNRPECVLTHSSGLVFVSNWASLGGVSVVDASGQCSNLFCAGVKHPLRPNGIALESGGTFLLAHLGETEGGVFRLGQHGKIQPVVTHADGVPLPPTNFITLDALDRLWITVSTTKIPRASDYRSSACTGFIALAEPGESNARIVARELGYTNECFVDLIQSAVFVNETFARRLTRFDLASDGSLSNRSTVTQFGTGVFPDGVTLDEDGNCWIASIVSNQIIKVSPVGEQMLILEDSDADFVARAEKAYQANRMGPEHLGSTGRARLKNTSSIAFGGPDRTTAYVGNLLDNCVYHFDAGVVGRAPVHWETPLGHLESYIDCG